MERRAIFAGCYLMIAAGLAFFAKLTFFHGISMEFIQSLFFLGAGLISTVILTHYEAVDDLEEELKRQGLRGEFATHPERFGTQSDERLSAFADRERRFPNREAPDPQAIDEEDGDPRYGHASPLGIALVKLDRRPDAVALMGSRNRTANEQDDPQPGIRQQTQERNETTPAEHCNAG